MKREHGHCPDASPWSYEGTVHAGEYLAYRTYLDSHIKPGVHYRIRPTGHTDYLFHGKSVRLLSVRPAEYCYRMTFEVPDDERTDPHDEKSRCLFTDNWQPEGVALTPAARDMATGRLTRKMWDGTTST